MDFIQCNSSGVIPLGSLNAREYNAIFWEHLMCKLHKSLYELKQSPRAWIQKLDAFLKNIEFVRSDVDFSVYIAQVGDVKFFIVIYVDDLILMCNNKDKLLQAKEEFS
jgi:hypothetical protein